MSREFLHNLPMLLEVKQRIIYESIALASEIMEMGLANLHSVATECLARDPENLNFTRRERLLLISTAWQTVDQADLMRQLIHNQGERLNVASSRAFMETVQAGKRMRDRMDHLPGHLDNYLATATPMPPAHGAVSFTIVDPEVALAANGWPASYRVAVVMGASMQRECRMEGVPFPYDRITAPLDHFALQAFGEVLSLSSIVKLARQIADDLGAIVEPQLRGTAEELAKTKGVSVEKSMRTTNLPAQTLIMTATYNEPAHDL